MQQKCKQLPLGRLNMNIYDFHLNDRNVEMQDTLKILGVILDSKLNFIAETRQDSKDGMVCPIKHIVSCT